MKCPHCYGNHPDDYEFCPMTGERIEQTTSICEDSSNFDVGEISHDGSCCPKCGSDSVIAINDNNDQYLCLECDHHFGHIKYIPCPKCDSRDVFDRGTGYKPYYCNSCLTEFDDEDVVRENDFLNRFRIGDNYFGNYQSFVSHLVNVCGITLGKTTVLDIKNGNFPDAKIDYLDDGDVSLIFSDEKGYTRAQICNSRTIYFDYVIINCHTEMFDNWRELGFSWALSYNEWFALFERYNFKIEHVRTPDTDALGNFIATFNAFSLDGKIFFQLSFNFGKNKGWGNTTSSGHTLYSISLVLG